MGMYPQSRIGSSGCSVGWMVKSWVVWYCGCGRYRLRFGMADAACKNEFGGVDSFRIWSNVCVAMCAFSWVPKSCSCVWLRLDRNVCGSGWVVHGSPSSSPNSRYVKLRSLIRCESTCVSCMVGGGVVGAASSLGGSS